MRPPRLRPLRLFEHISTDGVIQNSADGGDFPYTDWTAPYRSAAGRDAIIAAQGENFDLLLGRRTYDIWSGYWPKAPRSPMADSLNAARKYVATHRPETLDWGPVEAVGPDVAAEVRRIKSLSGPDLVLWGSSTLTSKLLDAGLVDDVILAVYPVLLGTGTRLLAAGSPARAFRLISTQSFPSGVILNSYTIVGALDAG